MEPEQLAVSKPFIKKFGAIIFTAFIFLLPIFVFPSSLVPFQAGKASLVFIAVFSLFIFWLFSQLKAGSVSIPYSLPLGVGGILVVIYFLSSFFSYSTMQGIVGRGFELDSALSILSFVLILFLVPQLFRTKESVFNIYLSIFVSFFVVFLFGFIRVVAGPSVFTLNILTSSVSNLVGSWNDLGIFFGLITVLSLVMLEIVPPKGILRVLLYSALSLSLLSLSVVNFNTVWYVVGAFALVLFVYSFTFARSFRMDEATPTSLGFHRIPKSPLAVLFVALVFAVTGSSAISSNYPAFDIGARISNSLGITQLEARPSWGTTIMVAKGALKDDALLGSGPNQFTYEWLKHRPQVVNESPFWNIDFNFGIGILPSALISVGLLGFLAWVVFLFSFVYQGVKALRRPREDLFGYYLSVTAFSGALYLFTMAIFYTTSTVPFTLAFVMTGLLLATLVMGGVVREKTILFTKEPSIRFVALLLTIVFVIASVATLFIVGQRIVALGYFNKALIVFSGTGNLEQTEKNVRRAISIDGQDTYYRGLSEIALLNLNTVANNTTLNTPKEQLLNQFQALLGGAIQTSQAARDQNPSNYQNWISLARAYESVVPLKIPGAYDNAKAAYLEGVKQNPTSPAIRLMLARLDVLNNTNKSARTFIEEAIALKRNYTEAIFLLSQIEVTEGNLRGAIESVEGASVLSPNDATVFFQLGFLHYNNRDYTKASTALERAIALEPSYANARYFLGLSYDRLDKREEAIVQFEEIQKTNPSNTELSFILNNLKGGRGAFTDVKPPLDDKPEKRGEPPISEDKKGEI